MKTKRTKILVLFVALVLGYQLNAQSPGNALNFDGTDDYVDCGNGASLNITDAITVEAWINATEWQSSHWEGTIVGKDIDPQTGYVLRCGNNGMLSFTIGSDANWYEALSDEIMLTGQWYHVAGVFDGSTIRIYINGVQRGQERLTSPIGVSASHVFIGNSPGFSPRRFNGSIDEVRIWNVARDACQLNENMNKTLTANEAGLAAYYNFDQGIAEGDNAGITGLPDKTVNANNGTLNDFALFSSTSNWVASGADLTSAAPFVDVIVETNGSANLAASSIDIEGTITNVGSGGVSVRGVCYNTTGCPTTADSKVSENSGPYGTGTFTVTLSGLVARKHYARPYATNSTGTSYGAQIEFTPKLSPPGNALRFDGVDDYVSAPFYMESNYNVTLEAWVKWNGPNALESGQIVMAAGEPIDNGFAICIENDGSIGCLFGGVSSFVGTTQTLPIGTWTHLALVNNEGTWFMVIDGTRYSLSSNPEARGPSDFLYIGSDDTGSSHFNGLIDEVSIWDVPMDVCQINYKKNHTLKGNESNLLNYYNFDQGAVGADNAGINTLPDHSTNKKDGTLHAFALTGASSNWVASTASIADAPDVVVATTKTSNITTTSIDVNCDITNIGSGNVTERGVCFNTSGCPTTADSKVSESSGPYSAGAFTESLSGLTPGTVYYVKAYAINATGTSYGTSMMFNTCLVNIPDANFLNALIGLGIDANGNGVIECAEATGFTDGLDVSYSSISDMTGIEAFTNVTYIECGDNLFTTLHLSANTALQDLYCSNSTIDSLDLTANTALTYIECNNSSIKSLNVTGLTSLYEIYSPYCLLTSLNVTGLTALNTLTINDNKLTSLDVSTNSALQNLYCSNNSLSSLNVSNLNSLIEIKCFENQLASLDVSTNTSLQYLYCNNNLLTGLNVLANHNLQYLECQYNALTSLNVEGLNSFSTIYCNDNQLTSLDLSTNTSIYRVYCQNNLLTSLNVKNGNNTYVYSFDATNNPDLTCIQVDDASYSTNNWTNKDAGASYNTASCHTTWTGATNSDWNTSSNWDSNVVPTGSDDVIIKNVSSEPVVTSTAQCRTLVLKPGAQLTLNEGYTLSATKFLIYSDAQNGTGTFVDLNAAGGLTVSGSTKVQQYLGSGRNWYVSSPVETAIATILTATTDNALYAYKELDNTWPEATEFTKGWGRVASIGATNGKVYTFTGGAANTGPQSINLNRTELAAKKGFNLIGNPYPSYVNWELATKTNLETSIWYRTKNAGNTAYVFDTYNATGSIGSMNNGTAVTRYIAPMQAVWVRVGSGVSGALAFSNAMRSHQNQSISSNRLRAGDVNAQQVVRLQVSNGINSDEAIVLFNDGASDGYDAYDSPKMSNNNPAIPEIFTIVGNENVVINGLNTTSLQKELPLGFKTAAVNTFTMKATEMSNFDSDTKMVLKDKLLNVEYELSTEGAPYRFTSDIALTNTRFSIVFKSSGGMTGIDNSMVDQGVQIYKNGSGQFTINRRDDLNKEGMIMICNALGQILERTPTTGTSTVINKVFDNGVYLVMVTIAGEKITKKIIIN